jgi:fumarate reductase subunit D
LTVLPLFGNLHDRGVAMKRSKLSTREGLVMLFGIALMFMLMLWLFLSGIVRIND